MPIFAVLLMAVQMLFTATLFAARILFTAVMFAASLAAGRRIRIVPRVRL